MSDLLDNFSKYIGKGIECVIQGEKGMFEFVGISNNEFIEVHEIGRTVIEQFPPEDVFLKLKPLDMLGDKTKHLGKEIIPIELIGKTIEPSGSYSEENKLFGWDSTVCDDYQDYYLYIHFDDALKGLYKSIYEGVPGEDGYVIEQRLLDYKEYQTLINLGFDVSNLIGNKKAITIFSCT